MAYSPGYSIDIRPNGDTVRGAFEKYNAEVVKIYGILNTLDDKDITAAELETLKTGPIAGSRVTGTIARNRGYSRLECIRLTDQSDNLHRKRNWS